MPTLTFRPSGKRHAIPEGTGLLEAVRAAGFAIPSSCGSKGLCGKCRVRIVEGAEPPDAAQRECLPPAVLADGWRASCVYPVVRDLVVADPDAAPKGGVILTDFIAREPAGSPSFWEGVLSLKPPTAVDQRDDEARALAALPEPPDGAPAWRFAPEALRRLPGVLRRHAFACRVAAVDDTIVRVDPPPAARAAVGLAVDIGTTTLAVALCDLADGRVLAVGSGANPQNIHGDDVVIRSDYASRGERELDEMRALVANALAELCRETLAEAGLTAHDGPLFVVIAANTVMNHIFLGVPPGGVAVSPFVPAFSAGKTWRSGDIGWRGPEAGTPVHVLPNVSAYVGGDIVAGMLAHGVGEGSGSVLYLDIGTNGEMALSTGGRIVACAAAAGPAFEGARIGQGMRAAAGAVAKVLLTADGGWEVGVVDGATAIGLCGTGLLDAVAALLRCGIVDASGRLLDREEAAGECPTLPPDLVDRVHEAADGAGPAFWLVRPGEGGSRGVALTQKDIREFQLAKGAIAAGAAVLLERASLTAAALDRVLLAGGFGNYLDPASALRTGLLPSGVPPERIHSVGNAALAGARLCLLSRDERAAAAALARRIEYVELSSDAGFQLAFAEAMLFPET